LEYKLRGKIFAYRLLILVFILITWELSSRIVHQIFLAPPIAVFSLLPTIWFYPNFIEHLYVTFIEIFLAFLLSTASGLMLGFALGIWKLLRDTYEPILSTFYSIPNVVFYPLLLLLFGLDIASKIAFAYLLSFFPIVLTTMQAVTQVDRLLIKVAYAMGASKLTTFYKVIIPASLPTIMSGITTGLALCVTGVIVGEMLGGIKGLGVLIASAATLFDTPHYFLYVIIVVIIALLVSYVGKLFERLGGGVYKV